MSSIADQIEQALSVQQLINMLAKMDPNARVMFVCSYGDRCNTQQALFVQESEELSCADLYETAYSNSGLAVIKEEDDHRASDVEGDEDMPVVLLQ